MKTDQKENSLKLLIVDDDENMRLLLKNVIEETSNHTVHLAATAESGFSSYMEHQHQLIVLDILLDNHLSGVDILKRIKNNDPIANVIMITGHATVDLAVECLRAGAWDFITKPFALKHFEWVVQKASENIFLKRMAKERDLFLELSQIDGLTQIYNRRYFETLLEIEFSRATRYQRSLGLLLIDVDDFKQVNDQFGHPTGDDLLRLITKTIRSISRESDHLCRYGGDEFVLILPETDEEACLTIASKIKNAIASLDLKELLASNKTDGIKESSGLSKKISLKNGPSKTSVSIGMGLFPICAPHTSSLIRQADMGLLKAKKLKGKSHVMFHVS